MNYPIDDVIPQILDAVRVHPSTVLQAPPGAGKTTRVPVALLDIIPPEKGRIVILQPRRLAAVSAARWMAKGFGEEAGGTIGYTIRFDQRVSRTTRIEVVTEGILTRRIQNDPALDGVAMVIFDEFHERNLTSDLSLALCLDVRSSLRDDLKVMIMSATLDCGPVAALLGGAPVLTSPGRAYPVEERYLGEMPGVPLPEKIALAVRTALREGRGDVLVFLPGAAEIRACEQAVTRSISDGEGVEVHPLYGDLSMERQERAILPSKSRKIVLATNIAETGLTIENVGVVIDSGLTRRLQHDPRTGMNRLVTVGVSKASAEQRKGRAGRLGPGTCYRLYSRHQFKGMIPFAPPEIMLADLSGLVLELAAWGMGDPAGLSWLDAPPRGSWEASVSLLRDLGALDDGGRITRLGQAMVNLPLHPRLSKLALSARDRGRADLGAGLAALLAERDVMRRTEAGGRRGERDKDISTRLDLLMAWRSGEDVRGMADIWSLKAADQASRQILRLTGGVGGEGKSGVDDDLVGRLLAAAFPERIAKRREAGTGRYLLVRGRGVRLAGHSALVNSEYLVAAEVDAGMDREGVVHLAAPVNEKAIREECGDRIEAIRMVDWDERQERVVGVIEERLGAITLSSRPFAPSDEEAIPCICGAIRAYPRLLDFSPAARQFLGRVALIRRVFPEEEWPDLTAASLASRPEAWLAPRLAGARTSRDIGRTDLLSAVRALLTRSQLHLVDRRAPLHLAVPSGHRVSLDYTKGEAPVLAVKLQEMFGLAKTPSVAEGRVPVLLHLLSPAGRPVQITVDLEHFWNDVYPQVKKELKARYPKHPWPDDPWAADPTRKTKPRGR